jgi:hypothetical protein
MLELYTEKGIFLNFQVNKKFITKRKTIKNTVFWAET